MSGTECSCKKLKPDHAALVLDVLDQSMLPRISGINLGWIGILPRLQGRVCRYKVKCVSPVRISGEPYQALHWRRGLVNAFGVGQPHVRLDSAIDPPSSGLNRLNRVSCVHLDTSDASQ